MDINRSIIRTEVRKALDEYFQISSRSAADQDGSEIRETTRLGATATNTGQSQRLFSQVGQVVNRARNMMQRSTNGGVFRRLGARERLRACSESQLPKGKKGKNAAQTKVSKPFEFALLKCSNFGDESDDDEEDENLKKELIVERGMVTLDEQDTESAIREKLVSALKDKYDVIGPNDFEFIKVIQKKITVMHLSKGTEYNYDVVKKLAGQGTLYIRMKRAFQFVIDDHTSGFAACVQTVVLSRQTDAKPEAQSEHLNTYQSEVPSGQVPSGQVPLQQAGDTTVNVTPSIREPEQNVQAPEAEPEDFFSTVVKEFPASTVEPTEMLRYLQKKIVMGRKLDITDLTVELEGEVNYITVDRENILPTTFEELKHIENPRITFQVQFYGEKAIDSGGPRKEWIRLCNQNIKRKYFDNDLQEHLSEDYFYIGQLVCIALLQNGQLPVYIPEEILQAVLIGEGQQLSPCVMELKRGMDTLGVPMFGRRFPIFVHLLRPSTSTRLSVQMLLHLLCRGSNV